VKNVLDFQKEKLSEKRQRIYLTASVTLSSSQLFTIRLACQIRYIVGLYNNNKK